MFANESSYSYDAISFRYFAQFICLAKMCKVWLELSQSIKQEIHFKSGLLQLLKMN